VQRVCVHCAGRQCWWAAESRCVIDRTASREPRNGGGSQMVDVGRPPDVVLTSTVMSGFVPGTRDAAAGAEKGNIQPRQQAGGARRERLSRPLRCGDAPTLGYSAICFADRSQGRSAEEYSPGLVMRSQFVATPPWKSACDVSTRHPLVGARVREKFCVVWTRRSQTMPVTVLEL